MDESARTGEHSQEEGALLRGPDDLLLDFDRGFRAFHELVGGCRVLHDIGPAVTVFGSARFRENHRYYQLARSAGRLPTAFGIGRTPLRISVPRGEDK
jgi:hypothetical protein